MLTLPAQPKTKFLIRIVVFFMIIYQASPIFARQSQRVTDRDDILKLLVSLTPPGYEIAWTWNDRRPAVMEFGRIIILVLGKKGEIYKDHVTGRSALDVPFMYDGFLLMTVQRTPTGSNLEVQELESGDMILDSFFTQDVNDDFREEIIVYTHSGGTGGFGTLYIFSLQQDVLKTLFAEGTQGFEIIRLDEHRKTVIVVQEEVGTGAGARIWKDIYQWDGKSFVMADESFPEFYKQVIQEHMDDEDWKARFITGRAYEILRIWKEARAEYEKALEALKEDPSDYDIYKDEVLERLQKIKKDPRPNS